jgi:hypothetical protein
MEVYLRATIAVTKRGVEPLGIELIIRNGVFGCLKSCFWQASQGTCFGNA